MRLDIFNYIDLFFECIRFYILDVEIFWSSISISKGLFLFKETLEGLGFLGLLTSLTDLKH